ncbi:hypothetical protein R0J87_22475, partial [Halomonas sp. SIMBA_159]
GDAALENLMSGHQANAQQDDETDPDPAHRFVGHFKPPARFHRRSIDGVYDIRVTFSGSQVRYGCVFNLTRVRTAVTVDTGQ